MSAFTVHVKNCFEYGLSYKMLTVEDIFTTVEADRKIARHL